MDDESQPMSVRHGSHVQIAHAVGGQEAVERHARQRKQLLALVLVVLVLFAAIVGAASFAVVQVVRLAEREQQPEKLTSTDPPATLMIPGGWDSVTDLSTDAVFQARDAGQQSYVLVTAIPKEDLADGMTLEGYSNLALDWTRDGMDAPKIGAPAFMDRKGRSFVQTKIEGTIELQKTVMFQAVTEDSKRFYTIQTATAPSEYLAVAGDLERIIASFELPAGSGPGQL